MRQTRLLRGLVIAAATLLFLPLTAGGAHAAAAPYSTTAVVPVGHNPTAVALCNDEIYVANFDDDTMSVLNPETYAVTRTIAVGDGPYGAACGGSKVYVANYNSNSVSIINTNSHAVETSVGVGAGPTDLAVADGYVYVSNQSAGTVSLINTSTLAVSALNVGGYPLGVAHLDGKIYVGNQAPGVNVAVIDTATRSVITPGINVGAKTKFIAATQGFIYIVDATDTPTEGRLFKVSAQTGAVVSTLSFPSQLTGITTANGFAYVTSFAGNKMYAVDLSNFSLVATVLVGNCPDGVAISASNAFVANQCSHDVSVVAVTAETDPSPSQTPTPDPTQPSDQPTQSVPSSEPETTPGQDSNPAAAPLLQEMQRLPKGVALPSVSRLRSTLADKRTVVVLSRSVKTDAGSQVQVRAKCAFTGHWLRPRGDVLGCWLTRSSDGKVTMHVAGNGTMNIDLTLWASATATHQALYVDRKYTLRLK